MSPGTLLEICFAGSVDALCRPYWLSYSIASRTVRDQLIASMIVTEDQPCLSGHVCSETFRRCNFDGWYQHLNDDWQMFAWKPHFNCCRFVFHFFVHMFWLSLLCHLKRFSFTVNLSLYRFYVIVCPVQALGAVEWVLSISWRDGIKGSKPGFSFIRLSLVYVSK